MILCEKILGSMADPAFADCQADYVEIEWHEAYKRLHQKTTGSGLEIGIRLATDILTRGPVSYTHLDVYKRQAWG